MERDSEFKRLLIHTRTMEMIQPPRTLKAEQKKIEVDHWQRKNQLLWKRLENTLNKETTEEIERK